MPGETFNLGGGELVTVIEVIRKLERIIGKPAIIERHPPRKGDQLATGADVTKLFRHLGWKPRPSIDDGLAKQVEWQRSLYRNPPRRPTIAERSSENGDVSFADLDTLPNRSTDARLLEPQLSCTR